jgi:hypothetical protein
MAGIPPTYSIVFVAGDAVKFKFQVTDKDLDYPDNPPIPRNLSGWTAESQIRKSSTADTVEASWVITEPLGADGVVQMYLSGPTTQPWAAIKSLVSDVQLTDPAGDPETVLTLSMQISQDITRD